MNAESTNAEPSWQRIQKVGVVVGMVAALAVTGLFAYWVLANPGATTPLAILLAVLWTLVFAGIWNRRGTWRAQGTDTRALLHLVKGRARAGIRRAWLNGIGIWVPFAVAIPWEWHTWLYDTQAVRGWILAGAIVIAGTVIRAFRSYRRQRQKLQRTRALLDQLSREDGNP